MLMNHERLPARPTVDAGATDGDQVRGDAVADRPSFDALTELGDASDGLDAEHVGEGDREPRDAFAHVDVEVVERRGGDVDDDLARAGNGIGEVLDAQHVGSAELVEDDRFHVAPSGWW
jgi:hypothetical protein